MARREQTIEAFVSIAWEPDFEDPWILISDEVECPHAPADSASASPGPLAADTRD